MTRNEYRRRENAVLAAFRDQDADKAFENIRMHIEKKVKFFQNYGCLRKSFSHVTFNVNDDGIHWDWIESGKDITSYEWSVGIQNDSNVEFEYEIFQY